MPNFRYAETRRGDTLQRIALRELGDASQWIEVGLLNGLRPPYVVDDEAQRAAGVLVAGDPIRVPSAVQMSSANINPDEVFGRDVQLVAGALMPNEGGDVLLVGGFENYRQALLNRLQVAKRELGNHPEYGSYAKALIGRGGGPAVANLAAYYTRLALLDDVRTQEVPRCVATIQGDALHIDADVVPVSGRLFNFSVVI